MAAAQQQQPPRWARKVSVLCNGERINRRNIADLLPSNITSIEDYNLDRDIYMYGRPCPYAPSTSKYAAADWEGMGAALSESKVIKKLHLEGLTKGAVEALFGRQLDWPLLEVLELSGGKFHVAGLKQILPKLKPLLALDTLNLSGTKVGVTAARLLADTLNHTRIDNLDISGNRIQDEGLDRILSAKNARHLHKLFIGRCKISDDGFMVLSHFLSKDDTQLQELTVNACQDHNQSRQNRSEEGRRKRMLVESMPKASNLEVIMFGDSYSHEWLGDIQDDLFKSVCDTSTVASLIDSNHRLRYLNGVRYDSDLWIALEASGGTNGRVPDSTAIRRKLRKFYFRSEDFDLKYFNDMDVVLMPLVLELLTHGGGNCGPSKPLPVGVRGGNINGVYRLLRNCHVSELFSFPGPKSISTILWEKDERIRYLERANADLQREIEELRRTCSDCPSKRKRRG